MNFTKRIISMVLTVMLMFGTITITASAAGNTVEGVGFVTATALRLRSEPSTASSIVTTAYKNDVVVILSKTGNWYKVNCNLKEGYMHEDYLDVSTVENAELGYGTINGSSVNMRSGPSTSYSSVAVAAKGGKAYIIGLNKGWYKVIYSGKIGYIRSDFVDLTEIPYENRASSNSPKFFRLGKSTGVTPSASALNGTTASSGSTASSSTGTTASSATGSQILAEATKYLGTPYVYGGASPSGFDCSGFVYYVLKQVGYSPYRTPADQYNMGTYVSKDNLQPGDIVFFAGTYASGISHVGIYAGNGQFIHSPNSRSTVSYSDLTSGYWANHYYGARRMS